MQQRNLVLILARDLADKLATAVFVADGAGRIVYFNQRAEEIMGRAYSEVGNMNLESFLQDFEAWDLHGKPMEARHMPVSIALEERRPIHKAMRIKRGDDDVDIAVTALPLFARREEFVGVAAIFWEHDGEPGPGA